MTDVVTQKPLLVSADERVGPYVDVPVSQLDELQRLLDSRRISYWVEEEVISLDGGPEIATIDFGRGADAAVVQAILDSAR